MIDTSALRLEVRGFLAQARAGGMYVPRPDSWLSGVSHEFSLALGRRGWIGLNWPTRYGGRDRSELERHAITEELLAAGAPVALHWIAQRQTGPLLLRYGTEAQRQRFLPAIAKGECYFAIGMSEPGAGSDLAAVQTRADRVPGGWKVNGRKVWTSNAQHSQFAITLCRSAVRTEKRHQGLSQLMVDLAATGVSIRTIRMLTGEAHFAEVVLDDVFVPDEMLIGEEGNGWTQVTSELALERSGPERFFSVMPLLLELVRAIGKSPDDDEAEMLGLLTARLVSLRRMSVRMADAIAGGNSGLATEAALVKDQGTRFEQDAVEVIRHHLGRELDPGGTDRLELMLAQAVAAAPAFTLRGGTNEILRGIVARSLDLA